MIHSTGGVRALASAVVVFVPMAEAQELQSDTGVTSFVPAEFEQYNPTTALDMVAQVPGFSIDSGEDVRGFGGAAGNVLIDGSRPSTKSGLEGYLRRIPATHVERIDLVRGADAELDMRGQSRVVNVILREGVSSSQLNYSVTARQHQGGRASYDVALDWSGQWLGGDLTLSYNQYSWGERSYRRERRFDASVEQLAFRDDTHQTLNTEYIPGFEYTRDFGDRTTLRMNGRAWTGMWSLHQALEDYRPTAMDELYRFERGRIEEDWWGMDVGGDIERRLSEEVSSKIIWYHRRDSFNSDQRFDDYLVASGFLGAFNAAIEDYFGESILRSQTNWVLNDKHAIEFGGEIAYNFRDADRTFAVINNQGDLPDAIPVSTTKVEEWRGELFISDVWTPFENWTFEPSLIVEVSEISQTGDAEATRTFTYPKPAFTATHTSDDNHQWRFTVERRVAQLDFGDFVSSVSAFEDNVTSGNPDLEPEQAWRFDVGYERPFLTDGSLSFVARYDAIESVQGYIPVTASNGAVFDGPGNMGDGHRIQLISEAAIPTEFIGLDNGRLDLELVLRDSEVTDPVTGENRVFAYEQPVYFYAEFRQDYPEQQWSWGFDYGQGSTNNFYFIDERGSFERGAGDFDIYVETTRFFGVNLRFGADNVFDPTYRRTRYIYDGPRSDDQQIARFVREDNFGPLYYVRLKGTFG